MTFLSVVVSQIAVVSDGIKRPVRMWQSWRVCEKGTSETTTINWIFPRVGTECYKLLADDPRLE